MDKEKAQQILDELDIPTVVFDEENIFTQIRKAARDKPEEMQRTIMEALWCHGTEGQEIPFSEGLKIKLLAARKKTIEHEYYEIVSGIMSDANISLLQSNLDLTESEKKELWMAFHDYSKKISHSSWTRIDVSRRSAALLDQNFKLFSFVKNKQGLFGKLQILDLGCGTTGEAAKGLYEEFSGRISVFGIDMHIAEKSDKVALLQVNIPRGLPFSDSKFDIVYSYAVMPYFSDTEKLTTFNEVFRVLKKGGYFLFNERISFDELSVLMKASTHPDAILQQNEYQSEDRRTTNYIVIK